MRIAKIEKITYDTPKQFYDVVNAYPYNNFLIKTDTSYIGSHNCFFDEISFQPNQDIDKQKQKAKTLISTATARMQSRFMKGEKDPTLLFMASSKRTEQSFLETYIENKKKNESKTTIVVDEPQWVIRTDKDSPNKFKVAIGNKFLNSEVLPLNITNEQIRELKNRGYKIIDVPMGYYEQFIDDIDIALTDIAGISTTNVTKYISGGRFQDIKNPNLKNPFKSDIIEVGNGDNVQYYDYFDLSKIDPILKSRPLFIHLDMSLSGDKTGIAGTWIKGKKPHQPGTPETNELFYTVAFAVSVKAPKGYQISLEKNRNFIYWLKEQGFNIKGISSDTYQSADTGQQLLARGFKYEIISVDRVDSDHICKPYQYIKNTVYEKRIETFDSELMTEEFLGLERNNNTGKIDHPDGGASGSKDMADAITGSVFNASKHAEEFAFDFGETLDTVVKVSQAASSSESLRQQIQVDFENEMQNLFDPIAKRLNKDKEIAASQNQTQPKKEDQPKKSATTPFNFGIQPAEVYKPNYFSQGIILW